MAEYQKKDKEEKEGTKHRKKAESIYDQRKQAAEPEDSRAGQAGVMLTLQQTYGNRYVQRLAEGDSKATLDEDIIPKIESQRGLGKPLEPRIRSQMEAFFCRDLGEIKIHVDSQSDKLSHQLGAKAFTTGQDIFFHEGAYQPRTRAGVEILGHELSHALENHGQPRISLWGGADHKEATERIAAEVGIRSSDFIERLKKASTKMDTIRRFGTARGLWQLGRFILGQLPGVRTLGEGSDHGEGGDYRMDLKSASRINEAKQDEYVRAAIHLYLMEPPPPELAYRSPLLPGFRIPRPITAYDWMVRRQQRSVTGPVIEKLGDALHVAQDRGSHWEGAQGKGHDDPRDGHDDWSTDKRRYNDEGWANALNNTRVVLRTWLREKERIDIGSRSVRP